MSDNPNPEDQHVFGKVLDRLVEDDDCVRLDAFLAAIDDLDKKNQGWPEQVKYGARLALYEEWLRRLDAGELLPVAS